MSNPTLEEQMRALVTQAVRAVDAAQRHYREQRPEDYAALCVLVERGGARPYITVTLDPELGVEVGFEYEGRREPIYRRVVVASVGAAN